MTDQDVKQQDSILNESLDNNDQDADSPKQNVVTIIVHEGNDVATWFTTLSALNQKNVNAKVVIIDPTGNKVGKLAHLVNDPTSHDEEMSNHKSLLTTTLANAVEKVDFHVESDLRGALLFENTVPPKNCRLYYVKTKFSRSVAYSYNKAAKIARMISNLDYVVVAKAGTMLGEKTCYNFQERLDDSNVGLCGGTIFNAEENFKQQALGGNKMDIVFNCKPITSGKSEKFPPRMKLERDINHPVDTLFAFKIGYLPSEKAFEENFYGNYILADIAKITKDQKKVGWSVPAVAYNFPSLNEYYLFNYFSYDFSKDGMKIISKFLGRLRFAKKWNGSMQFFIKSMIYARALLIPANWQKEKFLALIYSTSS